jgi:anaerobic selenocysteine-containing dehydrogenase
LHDLKQLWIDNNLATNGENHTLISNEYLEALAMKDGSPAGQRRMGVEDQWQKSACILCSINCGIEVKLDGRRLLRIRGDRQHPASRGYASEKAPRLDYYPNGKDRLTTPLKRRPDGTFEPIDWDTAIREVAGKLVRIRDTYSGATIFYYGGGGQGNHLGGAYNIATRHALGSIYKSNALAQEKTGDFGSMASFTANQPATPQAISSTPRSQSLLAKIPGNRTASRVPA